MNNKIFKKSKNKSNSSSGLSLIEVIVTLGIFTVVIYAITSLLVSFYRYNAHGLEQTAAIDSASRGIEPTINDIREVLYSDEGAYPLVNAATSTFSFYSDIDADDNIEKIRIFLDGDVLKKGVIKSFGDPLTYAGQPESIFILSENVRNENIGTNIFDYYNDKGGIVTNLTNISEIAFVTMNVVVNINPAVTPNDFTLRASASFRNIKPAVASTTNGNLLVGLVGHWTLDEGTGLFANDSTTNNNDGVVKNTPIWTINGKIAGALDFDSADWVEVPDSPSLDITGDKLTLSAWINKPSNQTQDGGIIIKSNGSNYNYQLGVQSSNKANFRVNTSTGLTYMTGTTVLQNNTWYHLVGVYDGTTTILYVDSVVDKTSLRIGDIDSTTQPLLIGRRALGDSRYFDGIIDDVRVYNRALSAAEVVQLYKLGGI